MEKFAYFGMLKFGMVALGAVGLGVLVLMGQGDFREDPGLLCFD